jgi:hypothetical protein
MEKEFVPYNRALKLKELGFDEPCLGGYIYLQGSGTFELAFYKYRNVDFNTTSNIYVSAPLFQQAFRFFREEYEIPSFIQSRYDRFKGKVVHRYSYGNNKIGFLKHPESVNYWEHIVDFESYEEAELACLDKLIELVEGRES